MVFMQHTWIYAHMCTRFFWGEQWSLFASPCFVQGQYAKKGVERYVCEHHRKRRCDSEASQSNQNLYVQVQRPGGLVSGQQHQRKAKKEHCELTMSPWQCGCLVQRRCYFDSMKFWWMTKLANAWTQVIQLKINNILLEGFVKSTIANLMWVVIKHFPSFL